MTTAAAIDRLVHHSIILELNVASYRLEQSKKNKARVAKTVPWCITLDNSKGISRLRFWWQK